MNQPRTGESRSFPFRVDRLYFSDNRWFFLIRGGESQGPFESREIAQRALDKFVTKHTEERRSQLRAAS